MKWDRGFTARYYAAIVDPKTWRDTSRSEWMELSSGTINITDTNLRESADLSCKSFNNSTEYWLRVYLDARQNEEDPALEAIFTGLASVPNKSFKGSLQSSKIKCYSVLKPANDVYLPLGWYVMAGTNGARIVKELLEGVIPAPVTIEGTSPALSKTLVAESGETILTMVDYILSVIGWRLRISGDGSITICAEDESPRARFDAATNDVMELDIEVETNWFDCPNVFRAVNDELMSIARDEDPDSIFSIQNRGREIWMEDTSCNLNDGESIGEYAKRRLKEEQTISLSLSYNRRFDPNVRGGDLIYIHQPVQGIDGAFKVTSQNISLSYGATVSEQSNGV